ncbi:MAG: DUF5679 domain-containing protein [Nitrososphaeria archaeon]
MPAKIFYCVRCREKKSVEKYDEIIMRSGMKALKTSCPECGTQMYRIVGKRHLKVKA